MMSDNNVFRSGFVEAFKMDIPSASKCFNSRTQFGADGMQGMPGYDDTLDQRCYNCKSKEHRVNDCEKMVDATTIARNAVKSFKKLSDKDEVIRLLRNKLMEQASQFDFLIRACAPSAPESEPTHGVTAGASTRSSSESESISSTEEGRLWDLYNRLGQAAEEHRRTAHERLDEF